MAHISSVQRRWVHSGWLAGLSVAIALFPVLPLPLLLPVRAETHAVRVLTVTGQGSESLPTTLATISLAVEVIGPTAESVQSDMAERSAALVDFLQSQPIQDLGTTGIRLNPRYDYSSDQQRLIGYIASNTVRFDIAVDQAGDLLDDAVQAGATRIDNIQFRATDAAIAAAQHQALRSATLDAQEQADVVLATLNLTHQDIVGIQVNHAQSPFPPMSPLVAREASLTSTPVMASDQEVTASVTLQIQY